MEPDTPGPAESSTTRRPLRSWFAVLGAPSAWFAHLSLSYLLVPESCVWGTTVWLWVISLTHVAVAVAALVVAVGTARHGQRHGHRQDRFVGMLGVLTGALFTAAILVERLPVLLIDPCW